MPELPEVETIVRGLRRKLIGKKIAAVRVRSARVLGQSPLGFRCALAGAIIREIDRQGKFILISCEGDLLLVAHLRMTGQFLLVPRETVTDKHTHVIFDLEPGPEQLRYRDVRQFGRLEVLTKANRASHSLNNLGPDALDIDAVTFFLNLRQKKRAIKPLLLDQTFLCGLGNIYVDESLYRSRIHPLTQADSLSREQARDLHRHMRRILGQSIRAKGTTVSDYRGPDGIVGGYQAYLRVYARHGEPCGVCGAIIQKTRVGGRGTHTCPGCQPG
ncbi:MAG: bifunctional DNA-formamidopyrimidine glycosylase/DNA-(apurinic or apyrimidinic site) lyase [Desulfobacterota bacterium]|jgi:formamidopyrimidine-DNA glycosylase|nr:bifunctional DNA-formamidopyrimidine glycosylase/DNA-(apurinic or apyrimidinic site) lyase [Thermodesulfobacteriota bacterium]